jgi:phosphosulfolactate synthase (CoM biosynthesis protein A)
VEIYLSTIYKYLFNKIVLIDSAGVKPKISIKKKFKIYMFKCGKAILKYTSSKDKYDEILNSKEIKSLEAYPSKESIKLINNVIVIKL